MLEKPTKWTLIIPAEHSIFKNLHIYIQIISTIVSMYTYMSETWTFCRKTGLEWESENEERREMKMIASSWWTNENDSLEKFHSSRHIWFDSSVLSTYRRIYGNIVPNSLIDTFICYPLSYLSFFILFKPSLS